MNESPSSHEIHPVPAPAAHNAGAVSADSRWRYAATAFLVISTALRLCQLRATLLVPDEAYYWDWSRHHALGYYDQGPFIAYLIRATVSLFGLNEFGVRIGVLLSSLGTLLLAHGLAVRRFSPMAGFLTVLFLGLTPLMEVGSIIATYDPPLVFFWTLTVVLLERALFGDSARGRYGAWLLAGIAAGFGFLSKHTMLVAAPCLMLFLALSGQHRSLLRRKEPYIAFGIMLLMYSGVFWWNAHHHWWTFGHLLFLTNKAQTASSWLRHLGDFVGSQVLLVGPVLFIGIIAGSTPLRQWLQYAKAGPENGHESAKTSRCTFRLFLFCMGWPVFGLFLLLAFKAKVQGNWAAFAWITPVILWSGMLSERADQSIPGARRVGWTALVTSAVGLLLTLVMVFPAIAYRAGVRLKPDTDLTNQSIGWNQVAARVQQVRQEMTNTAGGTRSVFIVGSGYQYCAILAFYLPDHPDTYDMFLHYRLDMYAAYVDGLKGKLGQDAIFINEGKAEDSDLRRVFTEVRWDPPMQIYRHPYYRGPIRTIYIARCRGYRLYTGTAWHVGG